MDVVGIFDAVAVELIDECPAVVNVRRLGAIDCAADHPVTLVVAVVGAILVGIYEEEALPDMLIKGDVHEEPKEI